MEGKQKKGKRITPKEHGTPPGSKKYTATKSEKEKKRKRKGKKCGGRVYPLKGHRRGAIIERKQPRKPTG